MERKTAATASRSTVREAADPRLENEFGAHPLRQRPAILAQSVAVPPPMPACAASEASSRTSSPGSPLPAKLPVCQTAVAHSWITRNQFCARYAFRTANTSPMFLPPGVKSQKTYCQFLSFGYCLTVSRETKGGGLLSAYSTPSRKSEKGILLFFCPNEVVKRHPIHQLAKGGTRNAYAAPKVQLDRG